MTHRLLPQAAAAYRRVRRLVLRILPAAILTLLAQDVAPAQTLPYQEVQIRMRDGKSLAADLYVNAASGAKPTILVQTPYNKDLYRTRLTLPPQTTGAVPWDTAAYHYVVVDWRGFYGSRDADEPGYDRGLDGYDCVEWIAAQPWSDGKVGTHGGSALGHIQFLTARHKPPHLVCAVPMVKDIRANYFDYYYGGALRTEHVAALERLGFLTTDVITARPVLTPIWNAIDRNSDITAEIAVPMLIIGGWFDHYPDDVLACFEDLRTRSDTRVRAQHKLIFGPWTHGDLGSDTQGEMQFAAGKGYHNDAALRFFAYHLRGAKNGWPLEPVVRYFQMGDDTWQTADSWATLARDSVSLYLHDDRTLQRNPPTTPAASSPWTSDPRDPSPSHGGARFSPFNPAIKDGPLDIRTVVESRADALVFTTEPLTADLVLRGALTAHLFVSTDRPDSDVAVRITEVLPDGRSMIMTDGIRRLRFRTGEHVVAPLTPGAVLEATIPLQQLALTLRAGHRLRIVVSAADWPRFDRNLQNGGDMYVAGDTLVAAMHLHHDAAHPSHIGLQVAAGTTGVEGFPTAASDIRITTVHPLPARAQLTVELAAEAPARATLRLVDALGRTAHREDVTLAAARQSFALDTRRLAAGTYLLEASTAQGRSARLVQILP